MKRHTVGFFVAVYPCGVVVICNKLFGSESISQVFGILIDFIEIIPDKFRLLHLIYDDVCHLYWFAKNVLLLNKNEIISRTMLTCTAGGILIQTQSLILKM